jgi:predicted nucleic acid-binding protein
MNLDDVPQGERIYVDANIFICHFSRVSTECRSFLARCESRHLEAFTGTHVLLEIAHRLMILEALHKGLISGGQPARKLKEKPEVIKGLSDYNLAVRQIPRMGVRVRAVTPGIIKESETVRLRYGLLTNDSVSVAMMRKLRLTAMATHDSDLLNIADLRVYRPQDIP